MASAATEKHKRLVRIFFNTFYDDAAAAAIEKLKSLGTVVRVSRSKIVPELYFVELKPVSEDKLEEAASKAEELLRRDDRVFGVKAYVVRT